MPRMSTPITIPPQHQPDAVLNQDNPVSGQFYTVLDTTKNARLLFIHVSVTFTEVPTLLELRVIIDGVTLTWTHTDPGSEIKYEAIFGAPFNDTYRLVLAGDVSPFAAFLLEGRSVKVEAEVTGGTVSNLSGKVMYAKW